MKFKGQICEYVNHTSRCLNKLKRPSTNLLSGRLCGGGGGLVGLLEGGGGGGGCLEVDEL